MIDIRLITFLALSKKRSFTKAAEILNITQPAVSQHIKFLEIEYGVPLIKKNGKSFDFTEEGFLLLKYAEEIDLLYKSLAMKFKNKSSIQKTYNIGASMTIGGYVLPNLLGKHKKLNGNTDLLLHVHNTEEVLEKLLNGNIDFAMIEGPFDKSKFKFKKFKNDELVLVVSPNHEFNKVKEISIEDLISGNLILREKGSGTRIIFENKLLEHGYDLNDFKYYMEIGSISAIKSLVELNLGYAILSEETIKKELEIETLKVIPINGLRINRDFNFVYLHGDLFIEEFIEFVLNNI